MILKKNNKSTVLSMRLTEAEFLHTQQLAAQQDVKIAEYIRMRLFDDDKIQLTKDSKTFFNCDHDREIMRIVLKTFILVREIATKSLSEEQLIKCANDASQKLKEWGYE